MKEVFVRYLSLPDIENGVASFYENYTDKKCIEPSKPYISGRCHTTGNEIDELAMKVGFMTRAEFAAEQKKNKKSSWKNSYGTALSLEVGKALESEGITLIINGELIKFRCPKVEFVGWPWKKHVKLNV
jgi:hypothetical protein